jgi:hypothetical protein
MSLIPEYIIQRVLVQGISQLRKDRKLLDVLFRNIHQDDLQQIWQFVRDNHIDISINYPDEELKVPSLAIILRSESEAETFLGDLLQPPEVVTEAVPFRIPDAAGSLTQSSQVAPRVLMSEEDATGGSSSTLTVLSSVLPLFDPFEETAWVVLTEGLGAGQRRQLVSVSPVAGADTILTVTPAWETTPDATTKFMVVGAGSEFVGQPSKIFDPGDVVERLGAHYQAQYQIMITAQAPELVVYLYMIVKAIMLLNSSFLIRNGFLNLKMSGTDYMARTEYLPTNAYQRSLMLEFTYSFDVYAISDSKLLAIRSSITTQGVEDVQKQQEHRSKGCGCESFGSSA